MKLVLTRALFGLPEEELRKAFTQIETVEKGRPLSHEELKEALRGADVVICMLNDRIDGATASNLKCVVTYSVGTNHLNVSELTAKGIKIAHTPDVLTEATANTAWALLLAVARRLNEASHWMREEGRCDFGPDVFVGHRIEGATLGILGMGRIGQAVARRAAPFGMKVIYHNRNRLPAATEEALRARYVSAEELIMSSDMLSLHCPLTSDTRHFINERSLSQMKSRSVLVNTSRGAVVDETALIAHLKRNPEFRVGLDVYEKEPQVPGELLRLPNAFCLPHVGSAERETRARMAQICGEEAIRFAKGQPLRYEHRI